MPNAKELKEKIQNGALDATFTLLYGDAVAEARERFLAAVDSYVELFGEGECSVLVRSDMGEWKGDFYIKDGKASHSLALRGKNFVFTFTLQKGCVLRGLRTEFQAPDGKGV